LVPPRSIAPTGSIPAGGAHVSRGTSAAVQISPDGRVGAQGAEQPEAELPQRVSQGRGGASAAEARASQWKDARVTFDGSHGVAYNESVTAGLRRIDEDDDVTFDDPDVTGAIAISGINQQHDGTPNAGRASDVLKAITRYADANGEVLSLVPAASGRVNQDGLVAWYKRNGFEQRASGIMVRQPNSTRANRINFSQTRPMAPSVKATATRLGGSTGAMLYEDAAHQATKAVRSLAFLHDLVDEYKDRMPSVREWYRSMQATVSARMEMEEPAERIAAEALKLKDGAGKVNALVAKATTQQKWPYDPKIAGRPVTPDPVLAQEFKALTKDEQKVVQDIFAHGEHMRQYEQDLMTRLDLGGILTAYTKLDGPYAPLKRFGNYIAILKSQELRDAEQNDSGNSRSRSGAVDIPSAGINWKRY
jgi:hypothetical protein